MAQKYEKRECLYICWQQIFFNILSLLTGGLNALFEVTFHSTLFGQTVCVFVVYVLFFDEGIVKNIKFPLLMKL